MVSFDVGSASKVDDVTALPSRHKMADMCYYGNVMTTTRWWLCITILHLQQYSHRLNLFVFFWWCVKSGGKFECGTVGNFLLHTFMGTK